MAKPSYICVLIVDRSGIWASDLRARLSPLGVQVHVVGSRAAALKFASIKKIDVAILEYAIDTWTKDLCAALRACDVPCVYTAPQHIATHSGGYDANLNFHEAMPA